VFAILTQKVYSRGGKFSPRNALFTVLQKAGCANRLVAHYIIDQYITGNPSTQTILRLSGATGYDTTQISKW